jgi:hypothetical protein
MISSDAATLRKMKKLKHFTMIIPVSAAKAQPPTGQSPSDIAQI